MTRHTSPGDEEGAFERAGDMAQDWADVARGRRGAMWGGGRFRNPGANGCGRASMIALTIAGTAALLARHVLAQARLGP